jgi:Fe-Mn family superoxide dismutase
MSLLSRVLRPVSSSANKQSTHQPQQQYVPSTSTTFSPLLAHTFSEPLLMRSMLSTATPGQSSPIYKLPDLPYDYKDLEPVISGEIMEIHHKKHHQAYVNNLNIALEKYAQAEAKKDLAQMIALQGAIKFNGGGHVNHSIFWTNLASPKKEGGGKPEGDLAQRVTKQFGSLDEFINKFNTQTGAIQGSGWGWLAYNKPEDKLVIATAPNQDPLSFINANFIPLLGIDVWEHAYYLQYKNARPDYLKAIWQIVNWKNVAQRLADAKK